MDCGGFTKKMKQASNGPLVPVKPESPPIAIAQNESIDFRFSRDIDATIQIV